MVQIQRTGTRLSRFWQHFRRRIHREESELQPRYGNAAQRRRIGRTAIYGFLEALDGSLEGGSGLTVQMVAATKVPGIRIVISGPSRLGFSRARSRQPQ